MSKKLSSKGYETYLKELKKKRDSLLKRDLFPAESRILSKVAWEETYKATRNTLAREVKEGKRKVIGNVNQYIIQRQVYKVSAKQARIFKTAAEALGKHLTITQIRAGEFNDQELWKEINAEYQKGKASGLSSKELSVLIGQFYFGSE